MRKLLALIRPEAAVSLKEYALIHFLLLGPLAASLSHIGTIASSLTLRPGPSLNVATAM